MHNYLRNWEHQTGAHGVEGRYPFLDTVRPDTDTAPCCPCLAT